MARVLLIVTGVMEEKALARSLQGCFPEHEFMCKPRLDGFTTARLPPDFAALSATQRLLLNVDKFAHAILGVFAPGNRTDRRRPDFVVAVDDMELANADSPGNITRTIHDAVGRGLEAWPGTSGERLRVSVEERCSFHLMAPMTEAYFFADTLALARATAPRADHPGRFDAAVADVEAFAVQDPAYLGPQDARETCWRRANRRGHPKHYLEYLTDPQLDGHPRYREATVGCEALGGLAWGSILSDARAPPVLRFARSLFADLADMLGCPPVGCTLANLENVACHPSTWPPPRDRVLRNV